MVGETTGLGNNCVTISIVKLTICLNFYYEGLGRVSTGVSCILLYYLKHLRLFSEA